MIATISIFLFKTFNWMTAALFLTLTIIFYGFYFSSLSLRSDLSFGAIFTLYLFFFGRFLFNDLSGRKLIFNSFIVGILSIAVLATHWFGFFVQLYTLFYVLRVYQKNKNAFFINFIFLIIGIFITITLWAFLYGSFEVLLKSFVVALFQGRQYIQTINIPWTNSLVPYFEWKGGYFVILGFASFLIFYFLKHPFQYLENDIVLKAHRKIDYFIFFNLFIYFLFYFSFVGNQDPQYCGNIYFILILVASRGLYFLFSISYRLIYKITQYNPKYFSNLIFLKPNILLITLIFLKLFSSPIFREYSPLNLNEMKNSNNFFYQMKKRLSLFIPKEMNGKIALGGTTYQYIYDQEYLSTL